MSIRVAILGYGNLGKGMECAVKQNDDMELVAVFTRRDPATVKTLTDVKVYNVDQLLSMQDKIDVLVLCGGSATDLPKQTAEYAKYFNVVDSFDTHAKIPEHFAQVDAAAKEGGKVAMISVGWDPGMFSLNRLYANAILRDGSDYTFWGKGVSQGHSDAIRRIAGVNNRFHIKQINNAFEFGFGANRQLQSQRLCPQTIDNHIQAAIEVRSDSVHLVAETDSRNIVLVCLAPYGLGLRLNAGNGIEYRDCAVQNAQRTLDFNRKVNVSRRIDDVDSVAFPVTGCRSRGNGNTAFLLLFHPVHRCSTVVRLADFMIYACIIQDTFCCSGFTGINMSHDADISVHL